MSSCLFCNIEPERILVTSELSYAIADGFPVTPGHTLIIPKRHVEGWFGLTDEEMLDCNRLVHEMRGTLESDDASIQGFNIGANVGGVAGQTIFHCHIHLIPRREGDVANPRGGVRHLIPGKGDYRA